MYCCIDTRRHTPPRRACHALGAALCVLGLLLHVTPAPAAEADAVALPCDEPPLCYTASRLQAERNHIVLFDIDIVDRTRGISRITADRAEATGLNLGDSDVVLTGQVRMRMPEGELRADTATVQFADKRISAMSAQGKPATFEGGLEKGLQGAHGHAREITYDLARDELQLQGESSLSDGCNEINSDHIVYDIASQRVQADTTPGDSGRVHGTIRSRAGLPCTSGLARP